MILVLLLCHWLGDFFLQTSWMAMNKSTSWRALAWHVFFYSMPFMILLPRGSLLFILVNALLHLLTDALTSQLTGYLSRTKSPWFFTAHGFDQLIHATCLILTWQLLYSSGM